MSKENLSDCPIITDIIIGALVHETARWDHDVEAKLISLRSQAYDDFLDRDRKLPSNYQKYIKSDEWKRKRKEFLEMYGPMCCVCMSQENLHIHHRHYDDFGDEKDNSCIVLCKRCHAYVHPTGEFAMEWFQDKYPGLLGIIAEAYETHVGGDMLAFNSWGGLPTGWDSTEFILQTPIETPEWGI